MKLKTGQKKIPSEGKRHGEYSEKVYSTFDQSPRMGEKREWMRKILEN